MERRHRIWSVIMLGVAALGIIGGIQSDAPASEWGWFVAGCVIIWLVGLGVMGQTKKP